LQPVISTVYSSCPWAAQKGAPLFPLVKIYSFIIKTCPL
jgi:hypothetical protein